MPEGMRWNLNSLPSATTVCPALLPPCERTTISTRSASRSITLPLPSSPHWPPTRIVTDIAAVKGTRRTRAGEPLAGRLYRYCWVVSSAAPATPARQPPPWHGAATALGAGGVALGISLLLPRAFSDPVSVDPYEARLAGVSLALLGAALLAPRLRDTRAVLLAVASI